MNRRLPSLRNQNWKNVKVEIEKVNKLLNLIPTDNFTEMNVLIYAGENLVGDEIGLLLRNPKISTEPGWEMRLEGQIIKLR